MATAVMDQYMKMTTSKFVREALGDPIQKILETKQSCDVSASFILPIKVQKFHTRLRTCCIRFVCR